MMINWMERPSAEDRRKFSMICGEKTTTQQAIDMDPQIPEIASTSRWRCSVGGAIAPLVPCLSRCYAKGPWAGRIRARRKGTESRLGLDDPSLAQKKLQVQG